MFVLGEQRQPETIWKKNILVSKKGSFNEGKFSICYKLTEDYNFQVKKICVSWIRVIHFLRWMATDDHFSFILSTCEKYAMWYAEPCKWIRERRECASDVLKYAQQQPNVDNEWTKCCRVSLHVCWNSARQAGAHDCVVMAHTQKATHFFRYVRCSESICKE